MIQVYTGNGKGKTTAALGLALRSAGNGHKVYIAQFCKGMRYGELNIIKKIKNIKLEQFGRACFIKRSPTKEDKELAAKGMAKAKEHLSKGIYRLIILDEINIALKLGLLELKDVKGLIKKFPKNAELVLTGRYAHPDIIKLADLVSEIKEVKHYFKKGVRCRRGIEF